MQKKLFSSCVFIFLFYLIVASHAFALTIAHTPSNWNGGINAALFGGSNIQVSSSTASLNWNRPAVDINHVGYFRFNDLVSTVADDSTDHNSGTIGSGNTWKTSSANTNPTYAGANAAIFNTVGSANILVGQHLAYEYTQPWTVMAAVKQNGAPASASVIFTNVPSDAFGSKYPGYELWIDSGGHLHVRLIHDFSQSQYIGVAGTTNVSNNAWHYVAATYDGSGSWTGVKLYVDGVAETTTKESDTLGNLSIISTAGGNPYTIGNQQGSWLTQFNIHGSLDEFVQYNVAKSSSFIGQYTTASSLPPNDLDCVLYFHFNETSGTTAFDSSVNGFNGTASNVAILTPPAASFAGIGGSSLTFDGSTNAVASFPHISDYNLGSTFTLSSWANSLVAPGLGPLFYHVGIASPFPGWAFHPGYQNTIQFWDGTAFRNTSIAGTTGWHNWAVRFNNGTLDFFKDGTNINTITGVQTPSAISTALLIGEWPGIGNWNGNISTTTISNINRSDAYISQFAKVFPSSGIESLATPSASIGSGGGDFGQSVNITNLAATFTTPVTTNVEYRIGIGNTAADATTNKQAQSYSTLAASNSLNLTGQVIDYDIRLDASTDSLATASPTLSNITFTYTNVGADVTPPTVPGTPTTTTPSSTATPTWNWTASSDGGGLAASPYTVQWSQDATFATGVTTTSNISTNSYTIPGASPLSEGTWYFRAKAIDAAGNSSAYSSNGSVVVDTTAPTTPGTPTTTSPTGTTSATLTWTASTDSGTGLATPAYTVSWSQDKTFVTGVTSVTSSLTSYQIAANSGLYNGTWYTRVRSADIAGNHSSFSPVGAFVVHVTSSSDIVIDNITGSGTGYTETGTWSHSTFSAGFYGIDYESDGNTNKGSNTATWTPTILIPGNYVVSINYTSAASRATNIPLILTASDGTHSATLNESTGGNGTFFGLGTFLLKAGTGNSVFMSNTATNNFVIADAVKFHFSSATDSTSPTTPGTPSTTTPTHINTPTFTWTASTDNVALANPAYSVQWSQDATFATGVTTDATNTNSYTFGTALADGTWYFRVLSIDTSTNISSYSSNGSVVIDTSMPTVPGSPSITSPTNNNKPTLSWTASSDSGTGLANPAYTVQWSQDAAFVSGVSTDTTNSTSYTPVSSLTDGTWYFHVKASDLAGNSSAYTSNSTVVVDATAPTVPGTPTTTTPTNNNSPTWSWTASSDSGTGLANPAYTVQWCGNSSYTGCSGNTATTNSSSYSNSSLADGTWFFRVKASDTIGNASAFSSSGSAVVDTTAPGTPGSPSTTTPTNSTTQNWVWTAATDALSGVANYAWRVLNSLHVLVASGSTNSLNVGTSLTEGTYTFFVKAIDNAGNIGTESSGTVTVDTTAPSVPGTPSTTSPTNSTKPTWTWSAASDGGAGLANPAYTVQWSQDSSFNTGVSSSSATTTSFTHVAGLSDGTWYFRVKASDIAGNGSAYSSNGSVLIDTTAPSAPGIPTTTSPSSTATPTWSWAASTDSGSGLAGTPYTVEWSQDATFASGVSSSTSTTNGFTHSVALSNGTWFIRVKAADTVGNVSAYSGTGSVIIAVAAPTSTPTPTVTPTSTPTPTPTTGTTPTPTSSSSPAPTTASAQSTPNSTPSSVCTDAAPGTPPPTITAATAQDGSSIMIYFTSGQDPYDHYAIEFGTSSNKYTFGQDDIGGKGLQSYLVTLLNPSTTYYFRVRADNGCTGGVWSNEISAITKPVIGIHTLAIINTSVAPVNPGNPSNSSNPLSTKSKNTPQPTPTPVLKTYDVSIIVRDSQGRPVPGAKVTLHSTPRTAIADKNGVVTFQKVEEGNHTVAIAYGNYIGQESITLKGDVKAFNVGVTVKPQNLLLDWVVIIPLFLLGMAVIVLAFLLWKTHQKLKQLSSDRNGGVFSPKK